MKKNPLFPPTARRVPMFGGPSLQSVNAALKRAKSDFTIRANSRGIDDDTAFIWAEPTPNTVHLIRAAQDAYDLLTGDPTAISKELVLANLSESLLRCDPLSKDVIPQRRPTNV